MTTVSLLREQVADARGLFEGTLADVTHEQADWMPAGKALPIASHFGHVLAGEDMTLHALLDGRPMLAATSWAGRAGFDTVPSMGPGRSWDAWARETRFDLAALRQYAAAVHAAIDERLAQFDEEALARPIDLSAMGMGSRSVAWLLTTACVTNVNLHCGEISCIKGLLGAKGYPV